MDDDSAQNPEFRWHRRSLQLESIVGLLSDNLGRLANGDVPAELQNVVRSGIIKDFELAFELCWKSMKDYVGFKSIEVLNPRDAISEAWRQKLLDDEQAWHLLARSRNLFVHLYSEEKAEEALGLIRTLFLPMMKDLVAEFSRRRQP